MIKYIMTWRTYFLQDLKQERRADLACSAN